MIALDRMLGMFAGRGRSDYDMAMDMFGNQATCTAYFHNGVVEVTGITSICSNIIQRKFHLMKIMVGNAHSLLLSKCSHILGYISISDN